MLEFGSAGNDDAMIDTPLKQESKPRRREDILVSVCFGELVLSEETSEKVRVLAAQIDAACQFWEFVFVVFVDEAEAYEQLVCDIVNLRLVKVRRGSDFYQRRAVAASEAIGDVVVLTTTAELNYLDVPAIIDRANADGCIVICQRDSNNLLSRIIAWPLALIGQGAGFNVDIRDLLTIAFPRTLLNQVLTHMDRDLALRFPPRDGALPFAGDSCGQLWC